MRKPTDICLLCKSSPATKTNSHIYPKFISTNFLGAKKQPRRGFDLSSEKPNGGKPRVIQDSPKENYLFCDDCEAYLGVLEGIASDSIINWNRKVESGEYAKNLIINDLDVIKYNSADNKTIRLLVYSIFWRASISEHELFKNFRIVLEFEEELRAILMTYRFNNRKDYQIALTSKPNFKICPYTIITAKSFNDETANVLFAPYSLDPYALVVDRFGFMLYRIQGDIKVDFIKEFSNINPDDCKMMVFSEQLWHDTIVKGAFELLAKKTISYTMGKIYLLNKSNFVEEVLDEIPDIKFKLCRTISPEDYLKLKVLIELAKIELAEEPTTFGETSFTRDSATKDDICFTICLAVCQSDIIGYGIAYILKDKFTDQLLNEYYLDIVFVNKLYRGKQVSREIVNNLIKFVTTEDKVNVIKAKTQVSNLPAQRLLESFGFESLRS